MDAPVSGGIVAAEAGQLAFMAGVCNVCVIITVQLAISIGITPTQIPDAPKEPSRSQGLT